jgi:predicted transcriptional regulator
MGKHMEIGTFLGLLEEKGKATLATVSYNEIVENAIGLMLKEEYSQLPVMKGDKVVGVISYESLAKTVFNFAASKSKPPSKFRVKAFMERISKIFSAEDDVMDLMSALAEKSYVLICRRRRVTDIITSYDALWFFRTCGERFLSGEFEK